MKKLKVALSMVRWAIVWVMFGYSDTMTLMNSYKKILANKVKYAKMKRKWLEARKTAYNRDDNDDYER